MKKHIFSVEAVKHTATAVSSNSIIEVSGFTSEVSQEMLKMYFGTNKLFGGKSNAIETCVIVQEGIAHLKFKDPEGKIIN